MATKEKVLILSYYFPPCNLTPSERIFSWAKYLPEGNYYPIIITRNWDIPITNSTTDAFLSSGAEVKIERYENYEVHFLPYKNTLKDKLFIKLTGTKFYFIYLSFAFIYSSLSIVLVKRSHFSLFYSYAKTLLVKHDEIKKMVVSAAPFELFGVAFYLSKRKNIKWIADYRDDWSTSEMQYADNFPKRVLQRFSKIIEKKWLSNCSCFTSVSSYYVNKIKALITKEGYVMGNGFLPDNYNQLYPLYDCFTITYVGSIYPSQPIELFLEGIKKFILKRNYQVKLKIIFVGILKELPIYKRVMSSMLGFEQFIETTERVSKQEAIAIQSKSHLLLAVAYSNLKGIPGSKLYEYIALKKPVLLYPSDHDIIEETLTKTNQGLICENETDLLLNIEHYYELFAQNHVVNNRILKETEIEKYSRENQTNVLIDLLNKLGHEKK